MSGAAMRCVKESLVAVAAFVMYLCILVAVSAFLIYLCISTLEPFDICKLMQGTTLADVSRVKSPPDKPPPDKETVRPLLVFKTQGGISIPVAVAENGTLLAQSDKKKDTPPTPAAPSVKLPATVSVTNRAGIFTLTPDTNCSAVKWIIPGGLSRSVDIPLKNPLSILLIGDDGTYTVSCYGALGDVASDIASCVVTIGTPAPPPPPVPPAPSALTQALQTAFNLDTDADKATSLAFLQGMYPGMAAQLKQTPVPAGWAAVKTVGDASTLIHSLVAQSATNAGGLTAAQLVNLRKALQAEMVSKFGSTATTPIDLSALATELATIGAALKAVK